MDCSKKNNTDGIDIDRLCEMAALTLLEKERRKLSAELSDMLVFASVVCDADTAEEDRVGVSADGMRSDEARSEYTREQMLSCAAVQERGCPYVSKVIE